MKPCAGPRRLEIRERILFAAQLDDPAAYARRLRRSPSFAQRPRASPMQSSITCKPGGRSSAPIRVAIQNWLVSDGLTGFLVPVGDVSALADRITTQLSRPRFGRAHGLGIRGSGPGTIIPYPDGIGTYGLLRLCVRGRALRPVHLGRRRSPSLSPASTALGRPRNDHRRIGSLRIRLPVAAKIALANAGARGGTPGSPTPPGSELDGTMCTSTRGISSIRSRP